MRCTSAFANVTTPIFKSFKMKCIISICFLVLISFACKKSEKQIAAIPNNFAYTSSSVDGKTNASLNFDDVSPNTIIKITFNEAVSPSTLNNNILFNESGGVAVPFNVSFENNNTTLIIKPTTALSSFKSFTITISNLKSESGFLLKDPVSLNLKTGVDLTDKFPIITDDELLTLVQKQTFKYFWDFGHPVSGLARERDSSGDLVTSGGSGFGVMAILVGINRQFISRAEGLARLQKITGFLKNNAQTFHGAFPHWLNGATGAVIPFSDKDNGADLVETSYLMQGLLTARQYFNGADVSEKTLRDDINTLWNAVEWSWFRKNGENVLYWHLSPNYNWDMNHKIQGWNEALIAYVLASSSANYAVPKVVYDEGWGKNGSIKNGNTYYETVLPLGPANGGPLFFAHYSFLGINPLGLTDAYANYETQNKSHTLINYKYCLANPKGFSGYSDQCWGLTASDDPNGYAAHEPNNDNGVISPTAALSSFPYTPEESTKALKFFYYKLGDKIFKNYGFVDAFSLQNAWFANSFLAIDQGPIIIMIENHRSGLLWNLFMSCPEVKAGMKNLGFQSPNL